MWDLYYYQRMEKLERYKVDKVKISEWYPLQTTIEGMLGIFEHLFGMDFVEIKGEERDELSATGKGSDLVWHEDVQIFAAWDDEGEGGKFLGYLYFDLFPRKGKYAGPANFNLQPVRIKLFFLRSVLT